MEKLRILLIDNHKEVAKQVKTRLLFESDFDVCKVDFVSRVTESMLECKPDILLIDPAEDKVIQPETIRMAKRVFPSVIVIVLTAVVDTATSVELKKAGAEIILEKGIASEELVQTLRRYKTQKNPEQ